MDNYFLILVSIIGLCLGSFFNVVILRSLSGESIVFPASKCPKCGHKLYPWHNIPVISYIFLRGKCHFCKESISIQYPLVELTTMLLFGLTYLKFGPGIETLFVLFLISGLIIMTGTDIKERLVDCNIAIALAVLGVIFSYIRTGNITDSLLGIAAGIIIMEVIARLGYLFPQKLRVMGEADTFVAAALGAYFGLKGLCIVLIYSLIASMILALPVFLYSQYKNNNKITCIMFILFTLAVLTFKTVSQNYFTLGAVILTGILLTIFILKNIKKDSDCTYLPFVPALAAGTLYFIFF